MTPRAWGFESGEMVAPMFLRAFAIRPEASILPANLVRRSDIPEQSSLACWRLTMLSGQIPP